jgi:nitroreductase
VPSATPFAQLASERRSVRAFLPDPVSDETLLELLRQARLAPSGANLQPGHFVVLRGPSRQRLTERLVQAWQTGQQEAEDYGYFPQPMPLALKRRQVASAQALYSALGVARDDRAGRDAHFERNFHFFNAPVALLVTMEHGFGAGGYMDLGMTLYGLMLAAQSHGLATCAIGALASYPGLIRQTLGLGDQVQIVCGMALGYADPTARVNRTRTARCELGEFVRFVD